jgi:hypothetical protein
MQPGDATFDDNNKRVAVAKQPEDCLVGLFKPSRQPPEGCAFFSPFAKGEFKGLYRNATVWSEVISKRLRHRWFLQLMVSSIRTR